MGGRGPPHRIDAPRPLGGEAFDVSARGRGEAVDVISDRGPQAFEQRGRGGVEAIRLSTASGDQRGDVMRFGVMCPAGVLLELPCDSPYWDSANELLCKAAITVPKCSASLNISASSISLSSESPPCKAAISSMKGSWLIVSRCWHSSRHWMPPIEWPMM